jgi:hypothetical protein
MCDQCVAATIGWDLFPGWGLVKARLDCDSMKAGDWGLLRCNNPDFVWRTPAPGPLDPLFGLTEEEEKALPESDPRWDASLKWCHQAHKLNLKPPKGQAVYVNAYYELVQGGIQAGYDPDKDGDFSMWLFHRMGELVTKWPCGQRSHSTHNGTLRIPPEKRETRPIKDPEILTLEQYVAEMKARMTSFRKGSKGKDFWGAPATRNEWDERLFAYLHQHPDKD